MTEKEEMLLADKMYRDTMPVAVEPKFLLRGIHVMIKKINDEHPISNETSRSALIGLGHFIYKNISLIEMALADQIMNATPPPK